MFTANGIAENLGWVLDSKNAEINRNLNGEVIWETKQMPLR